MARPQPQPQPGLSRATVNGTTLVLTFDERLDERSVPAGGAFTVRAARRAIEVSEVAVSGREVTLTLVAPVLAGERASISYRPPSSNPLQSQSGDRVGSFGNRSVTNETPEGVPALPLAGAVVLAVLLMVGGLRPGGIARSGRL